MTLKRVRLLILLAAVIGDTFFSIGFSSLLSSPFFPAQRERCECTRSLAPRCTTAFIIAFHHLTIGTSPLRVSSTTTLRGIFAREIMKRCRENAGPSEFPLLSLSFFLLDSVSDLSFLSVLRFRN